MKEIKIYFAAPLFKQSDRIWNRMLKKALEKRAKARGLKIKILFPQDIAGKILPQNEEHFSKHDYTQLYEALHSSIFEADIILAILDGSDTDSGTAAETYGGKVAGKKIVGVRTDFRASGEEKGLNLMLSKILDEFVYFPAFNENHKELAEEIIKRIEKIIELYIKE